MHGCGLGNVETCELWTIGFEFYRQTVLSSGTIMVFRRYPQIPLKWLRIHVTYAVVRQVLGDLKRQDKTTSSKALSRVTCPFDIF